MLSASCHRSGKSDAQRDQVLPQSTGLINGTRGMPSQDKGSPHHGYSDRHSDGRWFSAGAFLSLSRLGGLIPVPLASQSSFAIRSPSEAPYARVPSLGCPTTPVPLRSDWNHGVQHLSCCCLRPSLFLLESKEKPTRTRPSC